MKYLKSFAVAGMLALCLTSQAQQAKTEVSDKAPWSVRMAQSEMTRCPEAWQLDFVKSPKWGYCHGVVLCAMLNLYEAYGDKRYYDYAEQFCDTMVHDDGSILQMVVWELARPVPPCTHTYKYRLYYGAAGLCRVRYDNERGKGDHRHLGATEAPYAFTTLARLLTDFQHDVERWSGS